MPAISALSGNLGLQAGSNTIRGLATGQIKEGEFQRNLTKELKSGCLCATWIASVIGTVGTVWCYLDNDTADINHRYPFHYLIFGGILFVGTFISMIVSTINGAGTPMVAHKFNLDPAKIAGPLETAFQDLVGQSFLLGFSYIIFSNFEDLI